MVVRSFRSIWIITLDRKWLFDQHPRMSLPGLPPEDRELSPYAGYTRAHWEAVADGLLRAAWQWATPRGALLDLPGRPSASGVRSDGLEGYARTFLAAAFRVAGAGGKDPHGWLERYAEGLAAGTATPGRDDAESWPVIRDVHVGARGVRSPAGTSRAVPRASPSWPPHLIAIWSDQLPWPPSRPSEEGPWRRANGAAAGRALATK